MSKMIEEVFGADKAYAENFGEKAKLPMPPRRHFAILTCRDTRLDPVKFAGLSEGGAHVIRNTGGLIEVPEAKQFGEATQKP